MSQQEPNGPYVYQPHGIFEQPWAGVTPKRLWAVSGLASPLARIDGLTREEAHAVCAALKALAPSDVGRDQ